MSKALAIPQHVAEFLSRLELVPIKELVSLPPEQRFTHAVIGDRMELAGMLYKGFALMGLKESLGHGNYLAGLAAKSIGKDTATRAINLAKLSTRVSAANFESLRNLPPSKLLLVVNWTNEELGQFFSGEEVRGVTLEDAQVNSLRELETQIKEAQRSSSDLEQQLAYEKLMRENAERKLDQVLAAKTAESQTVFHPVAQKIRLESVALSARAMLSIDDLCSLMDDLVHASPDLFQNADGQFEVAAESLFIHLQSVQAKIALAMQRYIEQFGEPEVDTINPISQLTNEEAQTALALRDTVTMEHHAEKVRREAERGAATPRPKKRGRKPAGAAA